MNPRTASDQNYFLRRTCLLVSTLLLYSGIAAASTKTFDPAQYGSCQAAFAQLESEIPKSVKTDSYDDIHALPDLPTVEITANRPGRHGGTLQQIRLKGPSWVSGYSENRFDVQGDPRWFIELVGEDHAAYLGFRILNDREITIPDYQEFAGALKKINQKLTEAGEQPIAIQYYQTPDNKDVTVKLYVEQFLKNQSIPVAREGNHLIHDMAFHSGAIFLPREYIDATRARMQFVRKFGDFIEKKYKDDPEKLRATKYYSYLMNYVSTIQIDSATAMVGPYVASALRRSEANATLQFTDAMQAYVHQMITSSMRDMVHHGLPRPVDTTDELLQMLIGYGMDPKTFSPSENAKVYAHRENLELEQLREDLQVFATTYKSTDYPDFNPLQPSLPDDNARSEFIRRICLAISERRRAIIRAIKELRTDNY